MSDPNSEPSVFLKRVDGLTVGFSQYELERILSHLAASGVVGSTRQGSADVWYFAASPYLLLLDLGWNVGRRLSELFQVSLDNTQPFNLRFQNGEAFTDLNGALAASGYSGQRVETEEELEKVYMAIYQSQYNGRNKYAQSVGNGESLVFAQGGADGFPALLHSIAGSPNVFVDLMEDGLTLQLDTSRDLDTLLAIDEVRTWRYVKDLDTATEGTSLVAFNGFASFPARMRRLQGAGGITITQDDGYVTITAPLPPPPMTVGSVGTQASLVSGQSTLDRVLLKGLVGADGVRIQDGEVDVAVGLGTELTTVRTLRNNINLLTVAADLRVDRGDSFPRLDFARTGDVLWNMSGTPTQFVLSSPLPNTASLTLQSSANLNGLIVTPQAELRWVSASPLRIQSSTGQTAITINSGGTADVVLNQLLAPGGARILSVVGQGSAASLDTGRLNATSIITASLSLRGSQTTLALESNNGQAYEITALSGGNLVIYQNQGTAGNPVWVPTLTIKAAGAGAEVAGSLKSTQVVTNDVWVRGPSTGILMEGGNVPSVALSTLQDGTFQIQQNQGTGGNINFVPVLTIGGSSGSIGRVTAAGQVSAASFRLNSEATPLPSAADYAALQSRLEQAESLITTALNLAQQALAAGSQALPYYPDDAAAKAAGLPQYALYRNGNTAFSHRMRILSDQLEYHYTPLNANWLVPNLPMTSSSNWTMEGWFRFTQVISVYALMQIVEGTQSASLQTNGGGQFELAYNLSGNYQRPVPLVTSSRAPDLNTWNHVAVVKNGDSVTLWYKGAAVFSVPVPQSWIMDRPTLSIGRTLPNGDGWTWQNKVSYTNVRVSQGALYTQPFTPRFPLEQVPGTIALIKGNPPTSLGTAVQVVGQGSTAPSVIVFDMPALDSYVITA